ncbi:interleukin-17B-like [Haliotis cracherodii]|uniref:interleukin-17B-like n=1 Tax=Haliotis cracherodii TaxID=6455 RepID=UPI0039EBBEA3
MDIVGRVAVLLAVVSVMMTPADCRKHRHSKKNGRHKAARPPIICDNSMVLRTDESMYLLPAIREHKAKALTTSPSQRMMTISNTSDVNCREGYARLQVKRTCPHYFVLNYDPDRIPSTIFEARCSCANCLSEQAPGPRRCAPVYVYRDVLIRRRKAGQHDTGCYEHHLKAFVVGCHCIGHIPDPQRNPRPLA